MRAPDGHILISLERYQRWAEEQGSGREETASRSASTGKTRGSRPRYRWNQRRQISSTQNVWGQRFSWKSPREPSIRPSIMEQGQKTKIPTVWEVLESWLMSIEKQAAVSTLRGRKPSISYHSIPVFGDLSIDKLTMRSIRIWIAQLKDITHKQSHQQHFRSFEGRTGRCLR